MQELSDGGVNRGVNPRGVAQPPALTAQALTANSEACECRRACRSLLVHRTPRVAKLAKLRASASEQLKTCGFLHQLTARGHSTAGMIGQPAGVTSRAVQTIFCVSGDKTAIAPTIRPGHFCWCKSCAETSGTVPWSRSTAATRSTSRRWRPYSSRSRKSTSRKQALEADYRGAALC